MGLSPEIFRHMTPAQMALTLAIEEGISKQEAAKAAGAKCVTCMDSGMAPTGRFCSCSKGITLGEQSYGRT